jgi:polyhydroxyalkanoate synthesis regulator phasin
MSSKRIQTDEIKKIIQDMNKKINKDVETLKKNQSKIKNSISQLKVWRTA